jgi:hypothetical protein
MATRIRTRWRIASSPDEWPLWVIRDWDETSNSSRHVGYVPKSGSEIRYWHLPPWAFVG